MHLTLSRATKAKYFLKRKEVNFLRKQKIYRRYNNTNIDRVFAQIYHSLSIV